MPDITYTLGGTSFDAVPETLTNKNELPVRTESTIARTKIHSVGLIAETIVLTGKYMTAAVKDAIALMLAACEGKLTTWETRILECKLVVRGTTAPFLAGAILPVIGVRAVFAIGISLALTGALILRRGIRRAPPSRA